MKLYVFVVVTAFCIFGSSEARRISLNMASPHNFMSSMMMPNPFETPKQSEIEKVLSACLAPISQTVDVVIDLKAWRPDQENREFESSWWPIVFRDSPMSSYDVADFVDSLSKFIPKQNLQAIIVDGDANNNTRYFLKAPVPTEPVSTTTTPAPVTGFTKTVHNDGSIMHWWYQQTYMGPVERPLPTLRQMLTAAFNNRDNNEPIEYPRERSAETAPTMFTVVITDSAQKMPLSALSQLSADRTLILDIGGKMAASERNYLNRNLLVVPDSSSLTKFAQAVQFTICQAAGGNKGQTETTSPISVKAGHEINVF